MHPPGFTAVCEPSPTKLPPPRLSCRPVWTRPSRLYLSYPSIPSGPPDLSLDHSCLSTIRWCVCVCGQPAPSFHPSRNRTSAAACSRLIDWSTAGERHVYCGVVSVLLPNHPRIAEKDYPVSRGGNQASENILEIGGGI